MTGLSMVSVIPIWAILVISLADLILEAYIVSRKNILNHHTIKRFMWKPISASVEQRFTDIKHI